MPGLASSVARRASSLSVVSTKSTLLVEQRLQMPRDRLERVPHVRLAFGSPEVREQHDARTAREQRLDRGKRRPNACVVGDAITLDRDVEVDTYERAFAAQLCVGEIAYRFLLLHAGVSLRLE